MRTKKKYNRENCWLCSHSTDGKTLKLGQINGFVEYSQLRSAEWSSRNRLPLAKPSYQHPREEENQSAKHQHHATKTRDANSPQDFRKLNKGSHGGKYMGYYFTLLLTAANLQMGCVWGSDFHWQHVKKPHRVSRFPPNHEHQGSWGQSVLLQFCHMEQWFSGWHFHQSTDMQGKYKPYAIDTDKPLIGISSVCLLPTVLGGEPILFFFFHVGKRGCPPFDLRCSYSP